MRIFYVVVATGVFGGLSTPAIADAQSYCGLFGRDYADGRTLDVDQWQINYRKAFDSCMTQYTSGDPAPKMESAEKISQKS